MSNRSLGHGLDLIDALVDEPMSNSDLAAVLGVHRTTVLRLLKQLEERSYVTRGDDGLWRPGLRFVVAGQQALSNIDSQHETHQALSHLAAESGQTCHLARLVEDRVIYLDKVDGRAPVVMASRIGACAPINSSAVAKAILAFQPAHVVQRVLAQHPFVRYTEASIVDPAHFMSCLTEVRTRGWAADRGEREPYLNCIAAPLNGRGALSQCAISLTSFIPHTTWDQLMESRRLLMNTCKHIECLSQ